MELTSASNWSPVPSKQRTSVRRRFSSISGMMGIELTSTGAGWAMAGARSLVVGGWG